MKTIKDEILQHREGQRIFTRGRVLFAVTLAVVAASIITWRVVKS